MTSTLKIVVAVVVVAIVGFLAYRMSGTPKTDMQSADAIPAATGNSDGLFSAIDAEAVAEAGIATDEDDTDLMTADSQAVTDLNDSYAENSF